MSWPQLCTKYTCDWYESSHLILGKKAMRRVSQTIPLRILYCKLSCVNFFPKKAHAVWDSCFWKYLSLWLISKIRISCVIISKCISIIVNPTSNQRQRSFSSRLCSNLENLSSCTECHMLPAELCWKHFVRLDIWIVCVCWRVCVWLFNVIFSQMYWQQRAEMESSTCFSEKAGDREPSLFSSRHTFFFPFLLLLLTHVAPLRRWRRKCLRQMSAASCLKPSTRAAELGKL